MKTSGEPDFTISLDLNVPKKTIVSGTLVVMTTVVVVELGVRLLVIPQLQKATKALRTEAAKWSPPTTYN